MTDSKPADGDAPTDPQEVRDATGADNGPLKARAGAAAETPAPRDTEPCNICRHPMPKGARKCTECEEWQSPGMRLVMVQGKAVVTILPVVTLCIGFIAQIDGLWAERLKGFHLSCSVDNNAGTMRRFSGETLVLSDLEEPLFLGALTIGPDGSQPVLDQRLNGAEGAQPVGNGPMPFSFQIAAETLEAICSDRETFAVTAAPLSLSASQSPIRIASCQC